MNKLRTRLNAISMPLKTAALAFVLQCGIALPSYAQDPVFPPMSSPVITDRTLGGTINGSCDWVNTDLYNLYPAGGAVVSPGYLHATAYDTYDGALMRWYVIVVVYNSLTNTFIVHKIVDARHPDVVIADQRTVTTPYNVWVNVVYENTGANPLSTTANQITIDRLEIVDPMGAFTSGAVSSDVVGSSTIGHADQYPHIDMAPDMAGSTFLSGDLDDYAITWAEYNGTKWEIKLRKGDMVPNLGLTTWTIGDGQLSDVACVRRGTDHIAHVVHYDPGTVNLEHTEFDVTAGSPLATNLLESSVTIQTQPRIEAFNRESPGDVAWHAVAQIQTGSKWDIHEYRSMGGSIFTTDYSNIPVYNPGSMTTLLSNNPLFTDDGFAPCVAAGNGPRTLQRNGDIGNRTYTMGWWIDGKDQYWALSTDFNSLNAADDGYRLINQQSLTNNIAQGRSALALANGSNDGDRLAASWLSDYQLWNGSGGGITIEGKVSNNFSFKPSSVTIRSTQSGWLVYPNPATDYIGITGKGKANYSLTDMTGRALVAGDINDAGKVDISHLPQGMYLLQIASEGKTESIKVVKE